MRKWLALLLLAFAACSGPNGATARFRDAAAETGLHFVHVNGADGQYYLPEIMGSGCALFDYDNDGDLDVYLVQGGELGGQGTANRLFRNELIPSGTLRFTDATAGSGAGVMGYGMGAAVGDFDNDGRPDLYVTNLGSNVLLRNEGDGKFRAVTKESGTDDLRWSSSAVFIDYDRDGALDLFVANYVDFTVAGNRRCHAPTGEPDYCTPRAYRFVTDRLFRNQGNGTFRDTSSESRAGSVEGPGLGVGTLDVNRDGWPDLFVANDSAANFLWMNRKDGTFEETALQLGVAYAEDGIAKAGMGVAPGDFDNDGDEDLLVVNLMREGATLFRNDGGYFADASLSHRIGAATFAATGFGTGWFDFDNDSHLDLFVTNGAVTTIPEQRGRPNPFEQRNVLLRNPGRGGAFHDATNAAGEAMERPIVGRGAAFGDIDNDGDIDILVTSNNGPVRLYLNETRPAGNWLIVQVQGTKSNRMGLGAEVRVFRRGANPLFRRVRTDSSYLSASDSRVHFGLGGSSEIERVEVIWPSGPTETWANVPVNRIARLVEGAGLSP